jgi:hypothetical protein
VKGFSEEELASYIKTTLDNKYGRLLGGRFFQGTLQTVQQQAASATFLCSLKRTGETAADGNTYLCSTPGYFPHTGDVVECVWLDSTVGLVLWPVGGAQLGSLAPPATVTTNQGGITAEVDLAGLAVTVIGGSGRTVRVAWQIVCGSSVDGDSVALQVKDTYNGVTTVIGQGWLASKGVNLNQTLDGSALVVPAPGQHTYKLTLQRNAGTGVVTMIASAATPAFISVEATGG